MRAEDYREGLKVRLKAPEGYWVTTPQGPRFTIAPQGTEATVISDVGEEPDTWMCAIEIGSDTFWLYGVSPDALEVVQ